MNPRQRVLAILLLSVVAGCQDTDPVLRPDLWNPVGVNETNIAAMVAAPQDLVHGVDEPNADGVRAAAAVRRLETNHVKVLPDNGISDIKTQVNGGGQASDGAPVSGGT